MKKITIIILVLSYKLCVCQVLLDANGQGNTYEEITQVLAPGYNPVEVPDCNHSIFGRHIDEIFDTSLNVYVFRFILHTTPDNDRCLNFDRQRNEIKSYDKSPDNLLGIENEIVEYKWKFKLDIGLQVSSNFTHIHQLKSVGGSLASMPMYTLTLRKSNPDRIELRYAETDTQITLKQTDLTPLKGVWIQAIETIKYGTNGTYKIVLKKVSDDTELFSYTNNSIINWRTGADFVRPKWGIYRSLKNSSDLRDEEVLFANFSIEELSTLSNNNEQMFDDKIQLFPNPSKNLVKIKEGISDSYTSLKIYNNLGQEVLHQKSNLKIIDISEFTLGVYQVIFQKNKKNIAIKKLVID
ncbi:T9SS type A sorting domain-containing protein [Polaribacter porphyrae]|uniref:Fibronectin type III n=1 Tax=Polaribacter porphyrae TaxID=1137780 RepID=A0A2S7WQ67_9FLAO|nr:T9SS type A sorting domain-containing protein [Polaribacter porphyrae]PQJ79724.1 fibronectin type III [Polaribacter porphyrae]